MSEDRKRRALAVALAATLHLALGLALLLPAGSGGLLVVPDAPDHQQAVSVSLLSLDQLSPQQPPAVAALLQTPTHKTPEPLDKPEVIQTDDHAASPPPASLGAVALAPNEVASMTEGAVSLYREQLQAHLARYRRYPLDARRGGIQGVVYLHFVMDRDGRVVDVWIDRSSGSASLDVEALQTVQRAQPLPTIPVSWPARLDVTLPVSFALS